MRSTPSRSGGASRPWPSSQMRKSRAHPPAARMPARTTILPRRSPLRDLVDWITVSAPAQIIQGGKFARDKLAAFVGGPTTPTGSVVFVAATQLTFSLADFVEAGSKSIIANNTSIQVSQQSQAAQFLLDTYTDGKASEILKEYQQVKGSLKSLDSAIDQLSQAFDDLGNLLNPANPNSTVGTIDRDEGATPTPTPTPTPAPTPTPSPTATPLSGTFTGTYSSSFLDATNAPMTLIIPPGLTSQGGDVTGTVILDFEGFDWKFNIDLSDHSGDYAGNGDYDYNDVVFSFDFQFEANSSASMAGTFSVYDASNNELEGQGNFQLT